MVVWYTKMWINLEPLSLGIAVHTVNIHSYEQRYTLISTKHTAANLSSNGFLSKITLFCTFSYIRPYMYIMEEDTVLIIMLLGCFNVMYII